MLLSGCLEFSGSVAVEASLESDSEITFTMTSPGPEEQSHQKNILWILYWTRAASFYFNEWAFNLLQCNTFTTSFILVLSIFWAWNHWFVANLPLECWLKKCENTKKHQHLLSSEDSVLGTDAVSGPMTAAYTTHKQTQTEEMEDYISIVEQWFRASLLRYV